MKWIRRFVGEYRWLSNFAPCDVLLGTDRYDSVEHAYQAAKTLDDGERAAIRACATPGQAKRKGRSVTLRANWDELKIDVMRGLLRQKFSQEPYREMLIATDEAKIVEGNDWGDTFWGEDELRGGQNWLGVLIMEIRKELR